MMKATKKCLLAATVLLTAGSAVSLLLAGMSRLSYPWTGSPWLEQLAWLLLAAAVLAGMVRLILED